MTHVGITAFGGYVPRLRVAREEIAAAHAWSGGSGRARAGSARSACNWDEDTITMAVEAGRDCVPAVGRRDLGALYLATTTPPFDDRLNASVVARALDLPEAVRAADVTGSLRSGTAALLAALDFAAAHGRRALCVGSEKRHVPAASAHELAAGHGAAALEVGPGPGAARLVGSYSLAVDFVDHYRGRGREFDYHWEERWVRDEGYLKIGPRLVAGVLEATGTAPERVRHLCFPVPAPRVGQQLARRAGLVNAATDAGLDDGCGDTGAAHPLLLLVRALEAAQPGDLVLVAGFGQGGDAALFEVTAGVEEARRRGGGVTRWLAGGLPCPYPKYLAFSGLIKTDRGIRAEADRQTQLTALYRHRDLLDTMVGGRCRRCGTLQFPRTTVCVNPDCGAWDAQDPQSFADFPGTVLTRSADHLTYTPDPPAHYGMVEFSEGGRLMMDFTDVGPDGVDVGAAMRMVFRVKDEDPQRGFTRYFWKAAPDRAPREA